MTDAWDWAGGVGRIWAEEYRRTERAFAGIAAVLDAAIVAAAPAEGRAADVGCGVGSTALALAAVRPGLAVTGIDLSVPLVAIATQRGVGVPGLSFAAGDVLALVPGLAPLDLLVSRHGVMFFADPVAGFAHLRGAARAGAGLVFSCFGRRADNDWSCAVDEVLGGAPPAQGDTPGGPGRHVGGPYAPGPFGLADDAFAAATLARAGWGGASVAAHRVDYVVGAGDDPVADALAFYRRIGPADAILAAAPPVERDRLEARLAGMLRERIHGGAVTFTASIRIWTATAADTGAGEPSQ